MEEVKRGDIFYVKSNFREEGSEQRAGRPAIVVSNDIGNANSDIVTVVYLTTQPKKTLPTHIDIRTSARPSVALCEQICTISQDRLGNYVGRCTDYEMQMLDAALCISLGINYDNPKTANPVVKKIVKEAPAETPAPQQESNAGGIVRLLTERDTYKKLYDDLLEKVISGRAAV